MEDKEKEIEETPLTEEEINNLVRDILYDKYVDEEDYEAASVIEFNLEDDDSLMIDKDEEK
mgnify:FL=1